MDTTASLLLKKQLSELNKHPVEGRRKISLKLIFQFSTKHVFAYFEVSHFYSFFKLIHHSIILISGFSAGLVDDNDIFKWEVLIIGPPG